MVLDFDSSEYALSLAMKAGADFADARLERNVSNSFLLKNGVAEVSSFDDSRGIGVRVLVQNTLGFACTNDLSKKGVSKIVEYAIRDAKACARIKNNVRLAGSKPFKASYEVRQKKKFEDISAEEKLKELFDIEKAIKSTGIKVPGRFFSLTDTVEERFYANSEGSRISSVIPRVNFYFFITLMEGKKSAQRYWQHGKASGFEAMDDFKLPETLGNDVKSLKKNMDKAVTVPKGKVDVVVAPQITGIMVHESGGHPYEADRILGREAAQAGESFITPKSIGMKFGSDAVSISDDPTVPNSFGFYLYDDEGIKAGKKKLLENGRIAGFLNSRESAHTFGTSSNASGRASSFDREPIPRMSNTFVEPGDFSEEELIEGVKKGVYMKNFTEWNIDDKRVNQKYVGAEAYMIRNGRIAEPVSKPTIEISTFALYRAIDAVADNTEYHAGSCGKGEPMQDLPVWFGGPSMRIRGIELK